MSEPGEVTSVSTCLNSVFKRVCPLKPFWGRAFFLSLSDYFLSEELNRGSGHLTERWASHCLILRCFVWNSTGTWGLILAWKIVPAGKSCVFGTENTWSPSNYYSMLWCLILCVKRAHKLSQVFLMDESQKSLQALFNFKKFHEPEQFFKIPPKNPCNIFCYKVKGLEFLIKIGNRLMSINDFHACRNNELKYRGSCNMFLFFLYLFYQ